MLRKHILPNVYGVIIVYLTPAALLIIHYESFLNFPALNVQPPMAG